MGRPLFRQLAGWTLASALVAPVGVLAQKTRVAPLPAVTAEYLLRFARFTEWPLNLLSPDAALVFCTTDPLVAKVLTDAAAEKQTVGARAVSARLVQPASIPRDCSVLYLAGLDGKTTATLIAALPNRSVLTVGDSDVFTRSGGVIQIYVEGDRLRFVVNLTAAERARLRLSSKMLSYGQIVRE